MDTDALYCFFPISHAYFRLIIATLNVLVSGAFVDYWEEIEAGIVYNFVFSWI